MRKLAVAYDLWPLTLNLINVHPAGEPRSSQSGWDLSSSSIAQQARSKRTTIVNSPRGMNSSACARAAGAVLARPDRFIAFGCAEAVSYPTAALNADFDQILATNER